MAATVTKPETREFAQLVADEVAGRCADMDAAARRLAEDPHRWYRALVALVENVNITLTRLAAEEADFKAGGHHGVDFRQGLAELKKRRAATTNFKRKVEARLRDVKALAADSMRAIDGDRTLWRRLSIWLLDQFDDPDVAELAREVPDDIADHFHIAARTVGRLAEARP